MEQAWLQILLQIPFVGAFVWFSLEMQKRYQTSMDKRDEAYLKAINAITDKLEVHDKQALEIKTSVGILADGLSKQPARQTKRSSGD